MSLPSRLRSLAPALALLLLCLPAQAQQLSAWSKLVSLRPDAKLQEKLQMRPADANGNRPHFLKIERARGNLLLQNAQLVVHKMPAVGGKALTISGLLKYIRVHLMDMVDPAKDALVLEDEKQKEAWESEHSEGQIIRWISKHDATESAFFVSECGSDRLVLSTLQTQRETQPHLFSGNIQISVTTATPLDGCIVQIQSAVRATAAPTNADEWAMAEKFSGFWLDVLEQVRGFVKKQDGDCIPELTPPTLAMVPWNSVAKWFHLPQESWVGIEGVWASTDREKRFRIEFHGEANADFIERNKAGKEIRVSVPVSRGEGEKPAYILERPNDNDELLQFYEFKASTRAAIIEKKPEPSKMVLKRNSTGKMLGQWYGLSVSRDINGNLQDIKLPSKMQPRIFEFTPVGD